jgi:hypothetical protein
MGSPRHQSSRPQIRLGCLIVRKSLGYLYRCSAPTIEK